MAKAWARVKALADAVRATYPIVMTQAKKGRAAAGERADRLAQALRDNLRRRKAQARVATDDARAADARAATDDCREVVDTANAMPDAGDNARSEPQDQ